MARKKSDHKLTPQMEKASLLLATGVSRVRVAEEMGLSSKTIYLWMKRPGFRAEIRWHIERMMEEFEGRMLSQTGRAIKVVDDAMQAVDDTGKPLMETRLRGAQLQIAATVRLVTRYKELQQEGITQKAPILQLPEGTQLFAGPMPAWIGQHAQDKSDAIEVEAKVISGGGD